VTRDAAEVAERWATYAPHLIEHFATLRRTTLSNPARTTAWTEMRDTLAELGVEAPDDDLEDEDDIDPPDGQLVLEP
jgi:hypothetical protein